MKTFFRYFRDYAVKENRFSLESSKVTVNQGVQFKRERFHHKKSSFSKGSSGLTEDRVVRK